MTPKKNQYDLLIFAGEASGDLHGAKLIKALLEKNPSLKIGAIAGPKMRSYPIDCIYKTEEFEVMGFTDVFFSLPTLFKKFYQIKNAILKANPKITVFIDYPGFSLRMEKALRKGGYEGKLIHYICPSVWAWAKKRIKIMADNLDCLFTIFPFEKKCFDNTTLKVQYIGNPLPHYLLEHTYTDLWKEKKKIPLNSEIISFFPGSRKKEIDKNLPIQFKVAKKLLEKNSNLSFCISVHQENFKPFIEYLWKNNFPKTPLFFIDSIENYDLMNASFLAIATSGTITLELALHHIPTVVTYAIKTIDRLIAQKLLKIDLPHYCIVNIIENKRIFPELFGPNLTEENLFFWANHLLHDVNARQECIKQCQSLHASLKEKKPSVTAAASLLTLLN